MPQGADIASDPRREQGIDLYEQSNTTDGSNKVEWSIDAFNGTKTALYFRDHPYVELWIENTDSGSINWTLESSPTGSGNWSSVSSGSVGANSASKVYSNPVSDQYIRVDLDDTGHKVRLLGLAENPDPNVTIGSGSNSLGADEDNAHASGDTGVPIWSVRADSSTGTSWTDTNGDYSPIAVDEYGRPRMRIDDISEVVGQASKGASLPVTLASNEDTVTVTDDGSLNVAGTVDVEQQTPVQLENSSGTNIDPATLASVQAVESAIGDETAASQSADSTTPATVIERLTALVDALQGGQASDELRSDTHLPQEIVGEQSNTGVGTSGTAVNPSSNGVSDPVCDIYIENQSGENGEFRRAGATAGDGIKIPATDNRSFTDVTSTDGAHEVAARANTTDFLIVYSERS